MIQMNASNEVGNILRKTSDKLNELILRTLDASEEGDEEEKNDYLKRAHNIVKHSSVLLTDRRLKKLKEIYIDKTSGVPYWFRDIFKDGDIVVELVPTFGTVILNACREFTDMSTAKMSITLSPVDALLEYCRPKTCRINVSENIRFGSSALESSKPNHDVTFAPWRRPLTFMAVGDEVFRKRRVSLSGLDDERVGYRFQKSTTIRKDAGVRIVFINNKSDDIADSTHVTGVYRRLMVTRDKYLTWKFVL